jgi:peptidoglycan/LPS O-acetylase OafA/YrhL
MTITTGKPPESPGRVSIAGVHGLRGFAALLVFWYHARWKAGDPSISLAGIDVRGLLQACDIGVCLFFVLSGFLLTNGYRTWLLDEEGSQTRPSYSAYLVRRFARIYPLYLIVLAVFSIFSKHTYTFYGVLDLLLHLTCLHTFFGYSYTSINPVLWTIGIEFQFYLLLPLILAAIRPVIRRFGRLPALLSFLMLFVLLQFLVLQCQLILAPRIPEKLISVAAPPQTVFYYLPWFWTGVGLSLFQTLKFRWGHQLFVELGFASALVSFIALLLLTSEGQWRSFSLLGWPLNGLVCGMLILTVAKSFIGLWCFENQGMRFFGDLSFGIYVWHWPILTAVFAGTLPGRLGAAGALVVCGFLSLLITLGLSLLTYRFFEQPAIAWGHKHNSLRGFFLSALRAIWPGSCSLPLR